MNETNMVTDWFSGEVARLSYNVKRKGKLYKRHLYKIILKFRLYQDLISVIFMQ